MNNQTIENIEDEISLIEIIDFFRDGWKTIVLGGVVGGAIGVIVALISPSIYQATAYIQVAKVANADVEAPNILLEKLKMSMYYSPKTFSECNVENTIEPGKAIANGLNPTLAKGAPIISISYKEKNIDDAKKCLESVLNDIRTNQNEIAKPIFEQKKNQLLNLKQKLESAEQITKFLSSKKPNFDFSDSKFSASTLLLATTLSKENEVKDLKTQINDLEIALAEPQTKETYLTTPINAPNIRIDQKKSIKVLVPVFGGVFLAISFLILRRGLAKAKDSKKSI
uniref:Wzz/FepE/Etk N-terminal domain-containing protein n=1 Tax=Polynucleobacter sp. TaxID=2029855 RepID=UPI004047AFD8